MAQSTHRPEERNGNRAAEVVRRGAATGGNAARAVTEALDKGAQAATEMAHDAAETAHEATRATAEVAQCSAQVGAEGVHRAGDAARQGSAAAAEGGQQLTRTLWAASEEMRRRMPGFGGPPDGMMVVPQAFAGLLGEMVRTNLRIGQELVRLANPVAVIEVQQRFLRGYLDVLLAGQATLLGAAQRTAEDAQRQAGQAGEQARQGS